VLNKRTRPAAGELTAVRSLGAALKDSGLASIRRAWVGGADPQVVLRALGQWLSTVGEVYVGNPTGVGWSWFIKDYCGPNIDSDGVALLYRQIAGGLFAVPALDVAAVPDMMRDGVARFLEDAEYHEIVRREVLQRWRVLEREVSR
jgi:hypothetical protein